MLCLFQVGKGAVNFKISFFGQKFDNLMSTKISSEFKKKWYSKLNFFSYLVKSQTYRQQSSAYVVFWDCVSRKLCCYRCDLVLTWKLITPCYLWTMLLKNCVSRGQPEQELKCDSIKTVAPLCLEQSAGHEPKRWCISKISLTHRIMKMQLHIRSFHSI